MEIYEEGPHMNYCDICSEFITLLLCAFCKLLRLHIVLEEVNTRMVKVLVSTEELWEAKGAWIFETGTDDVSIGY